MGTKNNPGAFDCYAKLDPDEPYFTLRAKDPFAAPMVQLWASLAIGDIYSAIDAFNALAQLAVNNPHEMGYESDKYDEACRCSTAMQEWYEDHQ